ncbi:MAG: ZIP family metal transporter [Lachnospiraceae bacterium]|nr:ZIP family metal transporter [Lachnospiraceae bacterium]
MGIVITFVLGLFVLFGVVVVKLAKGSKTIEQLSIAIALGTMVSLVAMELIPEVLETFHGVWLVVAAAAAIVGIVALKVLDHFIPDHEDSHHEEQTEENVIHIGVISAVAIILHNIVEGMAVYSICAESVKVGMLVALGVGLHNIPMGMLMYSTLQKDSRKKQVLILGLAAVSTFVGGLLMALISPVLNAFVIGILICIGLGMLLYIIFWELIPHLFHSPKKWLSGLGILLGIAVIIVSTFLE